MYSYSTYSGIRIQYAMIIVSQMCIVVSSGQEWADMGDGLGCTEPQERSWLSVWCTAVYSVYYENGDRTLIVLDNPSL